MDLEKYVSAKDERLRKIFQLVNRLEPTLAFDDHVADVSFESVSLTSKPEVDVSVVASTEKADDPQPGLDKPALILEHTIGGTNAATPAKSEKSEGPSTTPGTRQRRGERRGVDTDALLDDPLMMNENGKEKGESSKDSELERKNKSKDLDTQQILAGKGSAEGLQVEHGAGKHGTASMVYRDQIQLTKVSEKSSEAFDTFHQLNMRNIQVMKEEPVAGSVAEAPESNTASPAKDPGLGASSRISEDDKEEQDGRLAVSAADQQQRGKEPTRKRAKFAPSKSQFGPIPGQRQGSLKSRDAGQRVPTDITQETRGSQASEAPKMQPKVKETLQLSQNEQELLEEIRERMKELMKEEQQEKAGREAKGLFENMMEYYEKDSVKKEHASPSIRYRGPPSKELVSRRGLSETAEKLSLYLEKPHSGDKQSSVSPEASYDQRDRAHAKDTHVLQSLFTQRILEMMINSKNDMHDRPKSVKIEEPEQKDILREAIELTLQELGPSFGLKPCLIPQASRRLNSTEVTSTFQLTSELKTEIMHNAACILRQQAQGSEEIGIQNLDQVINMNDGVMRNILHAGKFSKNRVRAGCSFDQLVEQTKKIREQQQRSQSQGHDNFSSFIQNAQRAGALQFFQSLSKKDINTQKLLLRRKVDELEDIQSKKLDKLKHLYMELEQVTNNNVFQEVTRIQVDGRMAAQRKSLEDENKTQYNNTHNNDLILDKIQSDKFFDYTSLESCMERQQILQTKYDIIQQRLEEALDLNTILKDMIKTNRIKNEQQELTNGKMAQKEADLDKVVAQVEAINRIEGSRQYQMNSVHFEYRKKIQQDQELMEKMAEEKEEELKVEEEEAQQVLYNILNHMRKMKKFKSSLKNLEKQKLQIMDEQKLVLKKFENKQEEIKMLNTFWQLSMMMKYNDEIDLVAKSEELSVDKVRMRGLKCVDALKKNILEVKSEGKFDLVQTKKQIERAKNLRRRMEIKRRCSGPEGTQRSPTLKHSRQGAGHRASLGSRPSTRDGENGPATLKPQKQQSSLKKKTQQVGSAGQMTGLMQKSFDRRSSQHAAQGPEQSESASVLSFEFRDSECSEEGDRLQSQLDTYINDRERYDMFFEELLDVAAGLDRREIMDTYLLSSIKNTQLRNAFKEEEDNKAALLQERERLEDLLGYYENESQIIGDYIRSKSLDQEIKAKSVSEYPISTEGMEIFLEELAIKSKVLSDRKTGFADRVLQLNSGFGHCISQAVVRLNRMHLAAANKIQFEDKEMTIAAKLTARYLAECQQSDHERLQRQARTFKRSSNLATKQKTFRTALKLPGKPRQSAAHPLAAQPSVSKSSKSKEKQSQSITSIAELDDDNDELASRESFDSSTMSFSDLKSPEVADAKSPLKALMNLASAKDDRIKTQLKKEEAAGKKTQERRLFRDLVALLSVLNNAGQKLNVAEKFARRLQYMGQKQKRRGGSMPGAAGAAAFKISLSDFDPVFRKQDFPKVRQGVLAKLNIDQRQLGGALRASTLAGMAKTKLKAKLRAKMLKEVQVADHGSPAPEEAEYAEMAQEEVRRQKEYQRKAKDAMEKLEKDKHGRDASGSSQEEKSQAAFLRRLEEHQQKMQGYVNEYHKKHEYRKDKNFLYKNKQIAQNVQKSEQFFIKDLKAKINSRYQALKDDFTQRYELKNGSLIVPPTDERSTQNQSQMKESSTALEHKSSQKGLSAISTWQKRAMKSLEQRTRKNEHLGTLRKSLMSPNVEELQMSAYTFQADRHGRPNLSQQQRTRRLYQSLVDTAANIKIAKESRFQDPRSDKMIKNLGSLRSSPHKSKTATQTDQTDQMPTVDHTGSFDLKKMHQVLSQQFSELRPDMGLRLGSQNDALSSTLIEKPTSLTNILGQTSDQMRPVTSPCFDMKDKRAFQRASLKDRIRINTELTKSVRLTQKKPGDFYRNPPITSSNDYVSAQQPPNNQFLNAQSAKHKLLTGALADKVPGAHATSAQNIEHARPMMANKAHSTHSSKVSIHLFNSQAVGRSGALTGPAPLATLQPRRLSTRQGHHKPYTANQAFNIAYQTVHQQRALKNT